MGGLPILLITVNSDRGENMDRKSPVDWETFYKYAIESYKQLLSTMKEEQAKQKQGTFLESRGGISIQYRMKLNTYTGDTKFTVNRVGVEYQYYEVLKYVKEKEKIKMQEVAGRYPFFEVDTIMIMKLAAMYVNEWACKGRIKLEYEYARLNKEIDALEINEGELVQERNAMMKDAVVSSSSSNDSRWKEVNSGIDRILGLKHQLVSEMRREYEIFSISRSSPKPKIEMTIRREESPKKVVVRQEESPKPKVGITIRREESPKKVGVRL